jgi:hypothetical protein
MNSGRKNIQYRLPYLPKGFLLENAESIHFKIVSCFGRVV